MAKRIEIRGSSGFTFFLQLLVGVFFFLLGLYGILPDVNEGDFSLDTHQYIEVIFGVLELICSVVLVAGLFLYAQRKLMAFVSFMIFIFWAARILLTKFILTIMVNKAIIITPQWLLILTIELIILTAILIINRRYAD